MDRYHRQTLLPGIGESGQARLARAHVLVVGCGALGAASADLLARAGVGTLTLVDRDVVEITNLQRQVLYDERDVEEALPKVEAARRRIAAVNRHVRLVTHAIDFDHRAATAIVEQVDVIVDGLDNFPTRYLLNDLAVARGLPYVYAGAVGTTGMAMTILPHPAHGRPRDGALVRWSEPQSTPCLRCLFPEAPPPGSTPTCDTAGVLGPVVTTVASRQAAETIKLLVGHVDAVDRSLWSIDMWSNEMRRFDVGAARRADCPCCGAGVFEFLHGGRSGDASALCGRNAVQITVDDRNGAIDLTAVAKRLASHGAFRHNGFLLHGRFEHERGAGGEPVRLTLFPDGRAILVGLTEPAGARALYDRYVGR